MVSFKNIILIEFNELSPKLLDRWMGEGKLPNFKKFYDQSVVHVTEPDVEDAEFLEPWIQWYSMHVGLSYDEHQVFHLTDGAKADNLDIWNHLKNEGKNVASFASMNTKSFSGNGHLYLPDPWCTDSNVFPHDLDIYQRFISMSVQEYTNDRRVFSAGDYLEFIVFMLNNGLKFSTIFRIINQLASEKLIDKNSYFKRVALLDRIQMDLFNSYFKHGNFDFATFFSNSTAHLQHAYWRFMEPEVFATETNSNDVSIYKDAILFGYQSMDELVGEMMELAGEETLLILASALSQQPYLKQENQGGQNFYRPYDVNNMLASLNVFPCDIKPTMTHQYMLRFNNEIETREAKQKLLSWSFGDGKTIFDINERGDENSIYFGNQIFEQVDPDREVIDQYNGKRFKHSKYFYRIKDVKSGCHHPDGILWFRTGNHKLKAEKASILDVFPTVTDLLGVPLPVKIAGRGRSLAHELELDHTQ